MRGLIDTERRLGLLLEPKVHAWCDARPPLIKALRVTYIAAHLPVALGCWRGPGRPIRRSSPACNKFAATQTLAAIGYVLAPTAPPRMVTGLRRPPRPGDYGLGRIVQSPHGAMPSAHTAFSLVAAGTFWAPAPRAPSAPPRCSSRPRSGSRSSPPGTHPAGRRRRGSLSRASGTRSTRCLLPDVRRAPLWLSGADPLAGDSTC